MSQVTDGDQVKKKKKRKKGFINVIPSVGQVCRSAILLSPSRGIRVRSYRFEKRWRSFPPGGGGEGGGEKFKNEGRNEPTDARKRRS